MNEQRLLKQKRALKPAVLNEEDAAFYIGMPPDYLLWSRKKFADFGWSYGPVHFRMPSDSYTVRYRVKDLDDWLQDLICRQLRDSDLAHMAEVTRQNDPDSPESREDRRKTNEELAEYYTRTDEWNLVKTTE